MSVQETKSILSSFRPAEHFLGLAEGWNPRYFAQKRDALYSLIKRIEMLPPTEYLPTEVVTFACGLSIGWQLPFALTEHEGSYSVQEKINILSREKEAISAQLGPGEIPVLPLKTVTLRVGHEKTPRYFLLTRTGNFPLDLQTKRDLTPVINQLVNAKANAMKKGVKINPPEFDPVQSLGISRGIVSPFVRRASSTSEKELGGAKRLSGLLYYQDEIKGFVAIAVSPWETLIIERSVFMSTLNWWQESRLAPTIPFRTVVKS